jgi:hypothetical protein
MIHTVYNTNTIWDLISIPNTDSTQNRYVGSTIVSSIQSNSYDKSTSHVTSYIISARACMLHSCVSQSSCLLQTVTTCSPRTCYSLLWTVLLGTTASSWVDGTTKLNVCCLLRGFAGTYSRSFFQHKNNTCNINVIIMLLQPYLITGGYYCLCDCWWRN